MRFAITQIIALRIAVRISNVPLVMDKATLKNTAVHILSAPTVMGRVTRKKLVEERKMPKPTRQVLQAMVNAFLYQGMSVNKCWDF